MSRPDDNGPAWPRIFDEDALIARLRGSLRSGLWTLRSNPSASLAAEAEREIAKLSGRAFALLVASGTAAVEIAARAAGAGPGTEVIVPALGWHATAAAVRRTGATVVFADVDRDTGCISPEAAASAVTDRTVAIVAVHLHCAVADMHPLGDLARDAGVHLIEDAAQAHGARYGRRPVGAQGLAGCFSFNQEKLIAAGEGGAIVSDDPAFHGRAFAMRTDGYVVAAPSGLLTPNGEVPGYNAAAGELQAALLLDQIAGFADLHRLRSRTAESLETALSGFRTVRPIATSAHTDERAYFEFGLRFDLQSDASGQLDALGRALSAGTGIKFHRTDKPVVTSTLYDPKGADTATAQDNAQAFYDSTLVFHHRYLLQADTPGRVLGALTEMGIR